MFSRESEIYTAVKREVQAKHSDVTVLGEYHPKPTSFPCVFFFEESATYDHDHYYGTDAPLFLSVSYQAQVFATGHGKKRKVAQIMATIREVMFRYGFRETVNQVLTNLDDSTISRRVGRWQAVVDKDYVYGGE